MIVTVDDNSMMGTQSVEEEVFIDIMLFPELGVRNTRPRYANGVKLFRFRRLLPFGVELIIGRTLNLMVQSSAFG